MSYRIHLGTRASPMAIVMAEQAKALIEAAHKSAQVEILTFLSTGDRNQGDLSKIGGKGAFVSDLEERLLSREIDCAIHCLKDIPGDVPPHPDLELFCFLSREDPRDALIFKPGVPEDAIGKGTVLATSSPRRKAFLKRLYPEAEVIPLRGNVNTRFRKFQEGQFDGMVLSYAGLQRLGLTEPHVTKIYDPAEMLPAVGQGILCLQVRREDVERCDYLRSIHSRDSEIAVGAEREMLRTLQGNCHSAIAGYCSLESGSMTLRGAVASPNGETFLQASETRIIANSLPSDLGKTVACSLLDQGAEAILR